MNGKGFLCERFLSKERSNTISEIKHVQSTVDPTKRKSPEQYRVDALVKDAAVAPPKKKKSKSAPTKKTPVALQRLEVLAFGG